MFQKEKGIAKEIKHRIKSARFCSRKTSLLFQKIKGSYFIKNKYLHDDFDFIQRTLCLQSTPRGKILCMKKQENDIKILKKIGTKAKII